eukprot:76739_1
MATFSALIYILVLEWILSINCKILIHCNETESCHGNTFWGMQNQEFHINCTGYRSCFDVAIYANYSHSVTVHCNGKHACDNLHANASDSLQLNIMARGVNVLWNTWIVCPDSSVSSECLITVSDAMGNEFLYSEIWATFGFDGFVLDCNGIPCFAHHHRNNMKPPIARCMNNYHQSCFLDNSTVNWNEWKCVGDESISCSSSQSFVYTAPNIPSVISYDSYPSINTILPTLSPATYTNNSFWHFAL